MAVEDAASYADLQREVALLKRDLAATRDELAEARGREAEGLAREAATSEILRVIASSPADLDAVLTTVAENAARLCECDNVSIFRTQGERLRKVAAIGALPSGATALGGTHPITPETTTGRAVLERRSIHLYDLLGPEGESFPLARRDQVGLGTRTLLSVPMLRRGEPLGAIGVRRAEVRPFTPEQVKLLESFADQAVIAIENTRLFQELEDRNRDLTEALEQQTATADILRVIASSPTDLQAVLDTVAENAARLSNANDAAVWRIDGDVLRVVARYGPVSTLPTDEGIAIDRRSVNGRAVVERRTIHVRDLAAESEAEYPLGRDFHRRYGLRTIVVTPLLREGVPLGTLAIRRLEVRPFSDQQIKLLETFADQAVIAIENTRLFQELQERNRELQESNRQVTEALEQQTATAEVLKAISRSAFDLQSVLETLVDNAMRLCGASQGFIFRYDGELLHLTAHSGAYPQLTEFVKWNPRPIARDSAVGRAALERQVVHIPDTLGDPEFNPAFHRLGEVRTVLGVPMLRDGSLLGVIALWRLKPRPFTDKQIELVTTFADQAAIAIENTRLLQDLREALEQQTATAEVLRAIASSPTDLQVVLDAVAERAARLCDTDDAAILLADSEVLRPVAHFGEVEPEPVPLGRDLVAGRAVLERRTLHVEDLGAALDDEYPGSRGLQRRQGTRTVLVAPLLREGAALGAILVRRAEVRPFSDRQIGLLETFADQAAIAIENTRLFEALQDKGAQLEEVSRHKSEFLANMSHELRTPLNAIIGFSEVLTEQLFGELNDKQLEYQRDILTSGQHLLSLINDILDLSKVEAGRMELELGTFSLQEALENGLSMLKERASRHGITLDLEIEPGLDEIEADERKVKQVVFNLLSNAVKFTPDGGSVDVNARSVDSEVQIAVRDTGIGIAPEDLEHVFEEFRQVGQGEARHEGTGLGLPLAKRFVELHSGRMWVESEVGQGSTFTFTLPLRSAGTAQAAELMGTPDAGG